MSGALEVYAVLAALLLYEPNLPLHLFGQESIKLTWHKLLNI